MKTSQTVAVSTEEYLGAVREHLAVQGASPERVGQHLEEMAGHLVSTGLSPVEEFGPPEVIADQLARADNLGRRTWGRMAALTLGTIVWGLALALLLGGSQPAILGGEQLGGIATMSVICTFAFSVTGAKFRDQLFGVSGSGALTTRLRLGVFAGLLLGAPAAGIVVELLVDDWSGGASSVQSRVAGLFLVALLVPATWWAHRRNLGRPRFPAGSPLRASNVVRQVHVVGDGGESWRTAVARVQGLVPLAVVFAMILTARWLREPYDLLVLVAAIAVGPAWLRWQRRKHQVRANIVDPYPN